MSAGYVVVVPSFQRAEKLRRKTLATLLERGIAPEAVYVYTHDHDPQLPEYETLAAETGVHLVTTDAEGIREQRRRIRWDFPEGTHIISMDDDVDKIMTSPTRKWEDRVQVQDLDALFRGMRTEMDRAGLYVWSIVPAYNTWFFSRAAGNYATGLFQVMFTMYGFINRHDHPVHDQSAYYKDEEELSLRAWWYDGGVVRHRRLAVQAEHYSPGGCQAEGRVPTDVEASIETLLKEWPGLTSRGKSARATAEWPEVELPHYRGQSPPRPADALPPYQDAAHMRWYRRQVAKELDSLL